MAEMQFVWVKILYIKQNVAEKWNENGFTYNHIQTVWWWILLAIKVLFIIDWAAQFERDERYIYNVDNLVILMTVEDVMLKYILEHQIAKDEKNEPFMQQSVWFEGQRSSHSNFHSVHLLRIENVTKNHMEYMNLCVHCGAVCNFVPSSKRNISIGKENQPKNNTLKKK